MKRIITAIIAIMTLGTFGACAADASAEPKEQVTVTETPEPEVETVEVTRDVTPQACITALDAAEGMVHGPVTGNNDDMIELLDMIPRAMEAGAMMDVGAIENLTGEIGTMTTRFSQRVTKLERFVSTYNTAADKCRASAN